MEVVFDEREFEACASDWRDDENHPARRKGYVRLRYLPTAVLVRFHEYSQDHGFGVGVVEVACKGTSWEFIAHDDVNGMRSLEKVPMWRVNLPLAPEKVRTVQTAQGLSMDNCVMILDRPGENFRHDDWWLHVYVMLSRVKTAEQLLIYGLPPRSLFERGPPAYLASGIADIDRRAREKQKAYDLLAEEMAY